MLTVIKSSVGFAYGFGFTWLIVGIIAVGVIK